MEFRVATDKDRAAVEWLWDYCFEKREDPFFRWFFSQYCNMENVLVGQQHNKITTGLHLVPYTLFLRGTNMQSSYIVGLATYPEARGGGTIKQLLQAALSEMRRRGHALTILMPSKAGFYYPYHWELCYHHFKYVLALEDLRTVCASWGELRPANAVSDAAGLQQIYQSYVADKHGYAIRDENYWQRVAAEYAGEHGYIYILEFEGRPEGYIMYALRDQRLVVREMGYTCASAYKALLKFLYHHRAQAEKVEWNAALDDLTYLSLPEPKKEVQLVPFLMGRIVDLVKALETINFLPDIKAKISLEIKDELAEWNNGVFLLEVSDGKGRVHLLPKDRGDVQCSIGAFSQLFFGRVSAQELANIGRLTTNFPGNIEILVAMFPKCTNYNNEYY